MKNPVSILGINCAYHEPSASLIQDGQLFSVVEEEHFNRVKYSKPVTIHSAEELPEQEIAYCLQKGGSRTLQK